MGSIVQRGNVCEERRDGTDCRRNMDCHMDGLSKKEAVLFEGNEQTIEGSKIQMKKICKECPYFQFAECQFLNPFFRVNNRGVKFK